MSSSPSKKTFLLNIDTTNLREKSARGGIFIFSGQLVSFITRLLTTIILARLLTPEDYGLIGMVVVILTFGAMFQNMGLNMAVIQKDVVTHEQISSIFWIQFSICFLLALLICSASPAIAWFYKEPRVLNITLVLSVSFLFNGINLQYDAILSRLLRFKSVALIKSGGAITSSLAAIASAYLGLGYWALVVQIISPNVFSAILYRVVCRWRPSNPFKMVNVSEMIKFGGYLTGFNSLNYFSRNLDKLLIGKFLPIEQLGLYNKAYELALFPLRQLRAPLFKIAVPTLSRLHESPDQYRQYFTSIQHKLGMILIPPIALFITCSDWIILLLLGDQWLPSYILFLWLSLVGIFQMLTSSTGWLFITQGKTKEMMKWGMVGGSLTTISFLVGLHWGTQGIAISYSLSGVLIVTPLNIWFACRTGPVSVKDYWKCLIPYILFTIFLSVIILAFRLSIHTPPIAGISISLLLYCLAMFIACIFIAPFKIQKQELLELFKSLLKPKKIK